MTRKKARKVFVVMAGGHPCGLSSKKGRALDMASEVTLRFISSGDARKVEILGLVDGKLDRTGLD